VKKKRKAWLVTASDYDVNDIWGVFTTKKKAEAYMAEAEAQARREYLTLSVEPYALNQGFVR
jgi:hypothetical protein